MSINFTSALLELRDLISPTIDELIELADRVSGDVSSAGTNATYMLYSGILSDDSTRTKDLASEIVNLGLDVFDVGSSDIGRFLIKDDFIEAFNNAVAKDLFGITYDSATVEQLAEIDLNVDFELTGTKKSGSGLSMPYKR